MDKANLLIWLDGKLVPRGEAKISVYDHGLLYGDGVFEGIRQYNGRVFEKEGAPEAAVRVGAGDPAEDSLYAGAVVGGRSTRDACDEQAAIAYIRLVVTRGVGYLGISPGR